MFKAVAWFTKSGKCPNVEELDVLVWRGNFPVWLLSVELTAWEWSGGLGSCCVA